MPTRPITLRLAEDEPSPAASEHRAALIGVVEDLVALLEAQFPVSPEFPGEALRTRLNHSRDRLRSAGQPEDASEAGLRLVGDASQAYARLSGHVSARESEFTGVIRLLRELVDGLRGDALAFRHDLIASSERVADLTQIEDIRTLRRALNREVDQLRQCVQRGEHQEASRFAQVAGGLKQVGDTMAQPADSRENAVGLFARAALLRDLASTPATAATLVVCRIDEPQAIVDGHGGSILERVIIALAQLLKGSFGNDPKVYRSSAHSVAMFLPRTQAKQVAQQVRKVQARIAPEYEYERHGVTRRVVFTFSSAIAHSPGRTEADAGEALARAERLAADMRGLSQLEAESSGLGRLVNWLSSVG